MISLSNISISSAAKYYFESDNYYVKDSPEHKNMCQWYGNLINKFDLTKTIEKNDFLKLLSGELPNGIKLGRVQGEQKVHAPGIDITFSAPKSVSILAEVFGHTDLKQAHKEAIKEVLQLVENQYMYTRKLVNGEKQLEKTNDMAAALFEHNVSRNLDPQLHTHCVLFNITQRQDTNFRSADFSKIFDDKLYLGQLYRHSLAIKIKELGYNIVPGKKATFFEIDGVPSSVMEKFSSRSQDIKDKFGESFNVASAKQKAKVTLITRKTKQETDIINLSETWKDSIKDIKLDIRKEYSFKSNNENAIKCFEYSLDKAFEKSSIVSTKDIISRALLFSRYESDFKTFEKILSEYIKSTHLLPVKNNDKYGTYFTSERAINLEKQTIEYMRKGHNSYKPILSSEMAKDLINLTQLNANQKIAAQFVLSNKDLICGIQG